MQLINHKLNPRRHLTTLTVLFITLISMFGMSLAFSPTALAAGSNGTTLLMVHGYGDTCDYAFNETSKAIEANETTTMNFLTQHGWSPSNIDDIGYYNPTGVVFHFQRGDQSWANTNDGIHGEMANQSGNIAYGKCDHNLFTFSTGDTNAGSCPKFYTSPGLIDPSIGTINEHIRLLGCELVVRGIR